MVFVAFDHGILCAAVRRYAIAGTYSSVNMLQYFFFVNPFPDSLPLKVTTIRNEKPNVTNGPVIWQFNFIGLRETVYVGRLMKQFQITTRLLDAQHVCGQTCISIRLIM